MKSIKLIILVLVLLFSVSLSTQAEAAYAYSDGTTTVFLVSFSGQKVTLQYCGVEADFSLIPEESNPLMFTYHSQCSDDKFSISSDFQALALGAFQFNTVAYLNLVYSQENGNNYPSQSQNVICYTCHGVGYCVVCRGTGRYSNYGQPSVQCKACNGSGKCWHCQGSGKQ